MSLIDRARQLVLEKIAEINVPSGTTLVIVSGLDGDRDKAYFIIFEGVVSVPVSPTVQTFLTVVPNNLSLSLETVLWEVAFDGTTLSSDKFRFTGMAGFWLGESSWLKEAQQIGHLYLCAMAGRYRVGWVSHANYCPDKASNAQDHLYGGTFWTDYTTKITSLAFKVNQSSFRGKLYLFRVI